MIKQRLCGLTAVILTFLMDQLTKQAILAWFVEGNPQVEVTPFLNLVLAANKGVSFGLLTAGSAYGVWALIATALGISLLLGIWIWQSDTYYRSTAFGLILGGALGNVLDRCLFGAVIDFLDFHVWGYHWYTFNIADCGIVTGALLLTAKIIRDELYNKRKENSYESK